MSTSAKHSKKTQEERIQEIRSQLHVMEWSSYQTNHAHDDVESGLDHHLPEQERIVVVVVQNDHLGDNCPVVNRKTNLEWRHRSDLGPSKEGTVPSSPSFASSTDDEESCLSDSLSFPDGDDDTADDVCAICLSRYQEHDCVCRGSNPCCSHIFHEDCLIGWLLVQDVCPMCQAPYLLKKNETAP
jgi:hypothetical protein